jgi:flagellar hook-associated protein 2
MASIFQMSGMVSGIDTKSMIQSLMSIERQPLNTLQAKITKNQTKSSAILDVNTQLLSLQSALTKLKDTGTFTATSASSSNSSVVSISSNSTAISGNYKLLEVSQLASASKIGSGIDPLKTISAAGFDVTPASGTIRIDGVDTAYTTGQTANTIIDNINSGLSTAGKNIRISFDAFNDTFQIKRTDGTSGDIAFSDISGNLTQVLKLSTTKVTDSSGNATYSSTGDTRSLSLDKVLGKKVDHTSVISSGNFGIAPVSNDGTGSATATIDGVQIDYNINTDKLYNPLDENDATTIVGKMNTALASKNIHAAYDVNTDRFTLNRTNGSNAAVSLGSGSDTGNLLQVLRLTDATATRDGSGNTVITSSVHLGTVKTNEYLTSSNSNFANAIQTGSFTINGKSVNLASTDTLKTLISKINSSDAGVTASYDVTTDRFLLTSKNTGANSITFGEDTTGFLKAVRLTSDGAGTKIGGESIGQNAIFRMEGINGGQDITRTSNSVSDLIQGVTLNLNSELHTSDTDYKAVTLGVSANTSTASNAISDLVSKFNSVVSSIKIKSSPATYTNGKKTGEAGPLNSDIIFTDIRSTLMNNVTSTISGLTGNYKSLTDIGITLNSSNELSVDSSKLSTALSTDMNSVMELFTNTTSGLSVKLDSYVDGLADSKTGSLKKTMNDLTSYNDNLNIQISNFEERLSKMEERLTKQYAGIEEAYSKMNSQTSQLSSLLSSISS